MHSFAHKVAGGIITLISMAILVVLHYFPQVHLIKKLSAEKEFEAFILAALFGLFIMCFSKEKVDDERVKQIRAKALQIAFGMVICVCLAIQLPAIFKDLPMEGNEVLLIISAFGLVIYHIFFHIGLYFDSNWTYNDDTVSANIRKNKIFFIFYALLVIGMLLLIAN